MYERLIEEVVTDENCALALAVVKRNRGAAGIDRMTTQELGEACSGALGKDPGKIAGRDLRSQPCEAELLLSDLARYLRRDTLRLREIHRIEILAPRCLRKFPQLAPRPHRLA